MTLSLWVGVMRRLQVVSGVELVGLVNQRELNGRHGRVCDFDNRRGRYIIDVSGQRAALQAANVIIPSGTRAMVTGLVTETQYNGLWATIQGFDRQLLRYTVKIGQGKQLRLRLENCLLGGAAACGMRPSPTVRAPPSPLPPLAAR